MKKSKIFTLIMIVMLAVAGAFGGGMLLSDSINAESYHVAMAETQEQIEAVTVQVDTLSDMLAERDKEIENLKTEKSTLEDEVSSLQSQITEKDQKIADQESQITEKNNEIAELESQKQNDEEENAKLQLQIDTLTAENAQLEIDKIQLEEDKTELDSINKQLLSQIDTLNNTISTKETEYNTLKDKYDDVCSELEELKTTYNNLVTENNANLQTITDLQAQVSNLKTKVSSLQTSLSYYDNADPGKNLAYYETVCDVSDFNLDKFSVYSKKNLSNGDVLFMMDYVWYLCDFKTGSVYKIISGDVSFYTAQRLSNGNLIFTVYDSSDYSGVYLYDIEENSLLHLEGTTGYTWKFFEMSNGNILLSGIDKYLYFYDATNKTVKYIYSETWNIIIELKNGDVLYSGFLQHKLYLFDGNNVTEFLSSDIEFYATIHHLSTGDFLLAGYTGSSLSLYFLNYTDKTIEAIIGSAESYFCFCELSNKNVLISDNDGGLYLLNSSDKSLKKIYEGNAAWEYFYELKNGDVLIASRYGAKILLYSVTDDSVTEFDSWSVFYSFSANSDNTVKIDTKKAVYTFNPADNSYKLTGLKYGILQASNT